jgi:3-methylcrotonyl-CoA carboxylase alpha subunit
MPSGGRLEEFFLPEGAGVRNDAGFEAGDYVPLDYDAMLAKLIVHAPDRPTAVGRLRRALSDYGVLGVPTNLPLLRRIAAHPAFDAGLTTTRFLERHALTEPSPPPPVPREALLLAAAAELHRLQASPDPFSAGPWRLLGIGQLRYLAGDREHRVEAARAERNGLGITAGGKESTVQILYTGNGLLRATIDGRPVEAGVLLAGAEIHLSLGDKTHVLQKVPPPTVDADGPAAVATASLTAPMPGTIVKVLVEEGEEVEEGRLLLVIEAMKMEQPVSAPHAGVVRSIPFGEGSLVPGGAVLAEVEPC